MSKAKVCDRCGKVYPVKFDKNYNMPIKIKFGCDYGKDTDYTGQDLCIECSEEFYKFIKNQGTIKIIRTDNTDHNEEEN